ncbi:MAG: 4-oxalocrotonate tautomerase family protein [Pseudomonadota bacterium]
MAIINVTLIKGRDRETKRKIMEGLTQVLIDTIDAKPHQVRVVLNEVEDGDYAVGGKPVFLNPPNSE